MANNKITATVEVTEKGLLEVEQKGKRANKQITELEKNTKAANKALAQATSPTLNKGKGSYDDESYRVSRAGAGTGAAGRDFAKQAQGLGGLVHVYATFAANIFAVTAAFTALDRAYATIRLEQAADIMSNKIGFSVKNLSKDLQEATGHSISFQEAMNFSAMGISAGLTGKQITNLTIIAKGAANALGRDMGDAVRRIVQGTAKQEQEILDELGIFVRAKTAYAEYAKKIGVDSVNSLTAQQRVQAYAEAVALAGEKWKDFAKIDDPFSKFTATLKEAGAELLNTINSAIAPLLGLLSKSKALIEGILLVTMVKLGRMALPHLGEQLKGMFAVDQSAVSKQIEGFNLLVAEREKALEQAHISKAKLGTDIRQSYKDISMGGINIGKAVLEDKPLSEQTKLPTNYLQVRENIARSIHSSIITETQLEEAKNKKLVWQKSTLDKLVINKNTLNSLAVQAVKVGEAENVRMAQYLSMVEQVANEEATITAMQAGQEEKLKSSKFKNTSIQADAYKKSMGIAGATDIGWLSKGGEPGKIKQIFGEMKNSFSQSEGALGKFTAVFKSFGIVASIALDGIMKAMPYVMVAFAAWELVIKPAIAYFNAANIKIAESTSLLKENALALKSSLELFKSKESSPSTMGEDFLHTLESKAQALSIARGSLDKLISDLESKKGVLASVPNLPTSMPSLTTITGTTGYSATGEKRSITIEASEQLKLASSVLAVASSADKETESYKNLEKARNTLLQVETNAVQFGKDSLNNSQAYIDASKGVSAALLEEERAILRKQAALSGIISPSNAAVKAVTEYFDKTHESSNQEITDLGIKHPILQKAYLDQETSIKRLARETDNSQRQIAANSIFADTLEIMNLLPKETEAYREALKLLQADFRNIKTPEELNTLLDKLMGINRGALTIVQDRKLGTSGKDTILQTKLGLAQEELKLRNLLNQQEERSLGYIKSSTLERTNQQELNVAAAEFAKESEGKTGEELKLINRRYIIKQKELGITQGLRAEQSALNDLKFNSIEPAQRALNIAKAEYDYKKKTIGTTALDDLKTEEAFRQESFNLKLQQLGELNTKEKQNAAENLRNESLISAKSLQTAEFELRKKERQDATTLGLEMYLARQEELIKGEDKLVAYDKLGLNFAELKNAQVTEEIARINTQTSATLKLLNFVKLRVSVEKDIADQKKRQHEIDKKTLSEAIGTKDFTKVLSDVGGWSTIMFNEAHKRTSEFKDSMRTVIEGAFDGLYSGMDSAIDNLTTKWMKSQKLSLKDIVLDFRNAAAEEFRKMAADQMKLSARTAIEGISLAVFGTPVEKDIPKAQLGLLESIDSNIEKLVNQTSPSSRGNAANDMMNTESSFFNGIGGTLGSAASGAVGGGLKGKIVDKAVNWGAKAGGNWLSSMFGFANGGIMSQYGAMQLNTYASGGIATSPQVAIFGEGRQNEAYVPLPDGKTIPVTMNMPAGGGQGTGPISINVTVNTTTGQSDTQVNGAQGNKTDAMAEFGKIISQKVREEIINQSRPNGLLSR